MGQVTIACYRPKPGNERDLDQLMRVVSAKDWIPLAVIGGLLCATVATLTVVPAVFSLLHGRRDPGAAQAQSKGEPESMHA